MSQSNTVTIKQTLARARQAAKSGELTVAVQIYQSILRQQPHNTIAKKALRKLQKNVTLNQHASEQSAQPSQGQINALINLCNTGQTLKAEKKLKELLQVHPNSIILLNILGGVLTEQQKYLEAVDVCNKMISIQPGLAQAYYNCSVALQATGQRTEAMENLLIAIKLKPDYAQAHSDLSLILLLQGDFKDGWKHHEWRMMAEKAKDQIPASFPVWRGEPLTDKVIFVRAEQGIGDEVMFASCFPDLVKKEPGQIIVECDSRLVPLFKRSFPEINVQGKREEKSLQWLSEFKNIDYQVAMGSLPLFFRSAIQCFPDNPKFLQASPELRDKWTQRFSEIGEGLKIGISWRGGSKDSMKASRSIEPHLWKPVLQTAGAHFINLQYGDCAEDIALFESQTGTKIHDWEDADPLTDLDNFAAQISALDLVISIDNSTVHFSGSVGVPTWILTPAIPDWRWMLERKDSPWYQTVKLFRQGTDVNWPNVFSDIKGELCNFLS